MTSIPLATGYNKGASIRFDASRLINFYAVPAQGSQKARSGFYLQGTEGLKTFCTISAFKPRGAVVASGMLYVVIGNNLYKITRDGINTNLGVISGAATVSISKISGSAANQQIIIVSDTQSFHYDIATNTLTTITDADFPIAETVTSLNNKVIVNAKNTGQFFWSALGDGTSWDALDFATAEDNDDNLVAVFAKYGDLGLFGEETTQIVRDNDNGYSNIATMGVGLASKHAITAIDNAVYFLGQDKSVYGVAGYTPQEVSSFAIAETLSQLDCSDAEMFSYRNNGHKFVHLKLPTEERTFVYDTSTKLWHERTWTARHYAYAFGKHLATDSTTGKLWEIDSNTYAHGDNEIVRVCDLSFIDDGVRSFTIDRLEFVVETGRGGYGSGDATDPQVMLSWSNDGGRTFGNPAMASAGNTGQYRTRVVFRNLGQFDMDAVLRLQVSSKTPWRIISADAVLAGRDK